MDDLISRQAAIDALHMHLMYRMGTDSNKKRLDDWINSLPSAQPEKVCIAKITLSEEQVREAVEKAKSESVQVFSSAQPEQKWIPCSKRLPEQYGNYLVSYRTDDFESDIGTFDPDRINSDTGEWSACDANGFYWVASKGLEVIAWMPLPEPYREDIE